MSDLCDMFGDSNIYQGRAGENISELKASYLSEQEDISEWLHQAYAWGKTA